MILTNLQQKLLQTVKKIRTNRKICGIVLTFSYNLYAAFLVQIFILVRPKKLARRRGFAS